MSVVGGIGAFVIVGVVPLCSVGATLVGAPGMVLFRWMRRASNPPAADRALLEAVRQALNPASIQSRTGKRE